MALRPIFSEWFAFPYRQLWSSLLRESRGTRLPILPPGRDLILPGDLQAGGEVGKKKGVPNSSPLINSRYGFVKDLRFPLLRKGDYWN